MRGPATGVAVDVAVASVAGFAVVTGEPGVCHVKAANIPATTSNRTSRILAAAIIKRRRFFGLRQLLPPLPSLGSIGGVGGDTGSMGSAGSRNISAAASDTPG